MTTTTQTRFARLFDYSTSRVLGITAGNDTTFYTLEPLSSDFGRAFRLTKAERGNGAEASYNVCLLDGGWSTCECLGHLKHGHRTVCKHLAALWQLHKLGLLPVLATETRIPVSTLHRMEGKSAQVCELDDL